jgi:preprotein translocase subunit YajC
VNKIRNFRIGLISGSMIALLLLTCSCVPATGGSAGGGLGDYSLIIFMVLIIGFLYFTSIRSQRKQQKKHKEMMSQLKRGDRVITVSGVYGEIESTDDISTVLKVESGATIRVTKASIAGIRQE